MVPKILCKFLDEEFSDIDPDFQLFYSQWQTTYRASLVTVTSTCEEYKDTLISAINAITKHSFLAKCQANFLIAKKKLLKVNEMIVLGDFAENDQFLVFLIVVDYLKENLPIVYKIFYFSDGCAEQCNCKNFINLCNHQQDFSVDAEWIVFATSHGKSPCDGAGGFANCYVAKHSLQRPLPINV